MIAYALAAMALPTSERVEGRMNPYVSDLKPEALKFAPRMPLHRNCGWRQKRRRKMARQNA